MDYILFFAIGWSVTSTLINGSIFDKMRNYLLVKYPLLGKLFSCVRCLGFWVGAFIFIPLILLGYLNPIFGENIPLWVSILSMPFFQSNFGILMESFLIYLLKGTKSRI